jgi:hypothetical protein
MAIATLFVAALTSVAFAGEWRGVAPADPDDSYRGYIVGPYAYANPENDAVTRSYYARPIHDPTHARIHHFTGPPALNAAPLSATHVPNIVVVKGQQVEIVSPDEVNSIDLQSEPRAGSAGPTLLAQALSVMAGALAALAVGLFLIGRRAVRISSVELELNVGRRRPPGSLPLEPAHVALHPATPASMLAGVGSNGRAAKRTGLMAPHYVIA